MVLVAFLSDSPVATAGPGSYGPLVVFLAPPHRSRPSIVQWILVHIRVVVGPRSDAKLRWCEVVDDHEYDVVHRFHSWTPGGTRTASW